MNFVKLLMQNVLLHLFYLGGIFLSILSGLVLGAFLLIPSAIEPYSSPLNLFLALLGLIIFYIPDYYRIQFSLYFKFEHLSQILFFVFLSVFEILSQSYFLSVFLVFARILYDILSYFENFHISGKEELIPVKNTVKQLKSCSLKFPKSMRRNLFFKFTDIFKIKDFKKDGRLSGIFVSDLNLIERETDLNIVTIVKPVVDKGNLASDQPKRLFEVAPLLASYEDLLILTSKYKNLELDHYTEKEYKSNLISSWGRNINFEVFLTPHPKVDFKNDIYHFPFYPQKKPGENKIGEVFVFEKVVFLNLSKYKIDRIPECFGQFRIPICILSKDVPEILFDRSRASQGVVLQQLYIYPSEQKVKRTLFWT